MKLFNPTLSYDDKQRFKHHCHKALNSDCIEWGGALDLKGYGMMITRDGCQRTHRVSYLLANGPFSLSMCICHTCDNRCCVNPSHLFLGTNDDNIQDKVRKGRHCRGVTHGRSKLTHTQVIEILESPLTAIELEALYPVSRDSIWRIRKGTQYHDIYKEFHAKLRS